MWTWPTRDGSWLNLGSLMSVFAPNDVNVRTTSSAVEGLFSCPFHGVHVVQNAAGNFKPLKRSKFFRLDRKRVRVAASWRYCMDCSC